MSISIQHNMIIIDVGKWYGVVVSMSACGPADPSSKPRLAKVRNVILICKWYNTKDYIHRFNLIVHSILDICGLFLILLAFGYGDILTDLWTKPHQLK